ncbi:MerR family DNA-binding protein [Thermithiobacillus plumbiphilus]|uniref:MerR family DNA-binding protein n=1 Tax=Thermithiobacillus plumbiphilus TaxID=1729899 RepID=A0ABU9D795_9PROT
MAALSEGGLSIGQVAKAANVNVETVRYYERRSLLQQPEKGLQSIRRYPADAVTRIRFIKHAQDLGFTLEEIKALMALRASAQTPCTEVKHRAEQKLAAVHQKIEHLQALERVLRDMIQACEQEPRPELECPILAALDSQEGSTRR